LDSSEVSELLPCEAKRGDLALVDFFSIASELWQEKERTKAGNKLQINLAVVSFLCPDLLLILTLPDEL
jgi:hypothetical protein